MKSIIPYERDITFDSKIGEITSISLEHKENITKENITGNFIVSGDYKTNLISVNKEEFSHEIPFTIELPDNVVKDSILFDINDFTYEIKEDNILCVKIEVKLEFDEEERLSEVKEEQEENIILDSSDNYTNTYIDYHIYNINNNDTIEDICKKYNITKDLLEEYNKNIEIKEGNKLIIPAINE